MLNVLYGGSRFATEALINATSQLHKQVISQSPAHCRRLLVDGVDPALNPSCLQALQSLLSMVPAAGVKFWSKPYNSGVMYSDPSQSSGQPAEASRAADWHSPWAARGGCWQGSGELALPAKPPSQRRLFTHPDGFQSCFGGECMMTKKSCVDAMCTHDWCL